MDYYLKNTGASRMYRVDYLVDAEGAITIRGAYACGIDEAAILPNHNTINDVDVPVDVSQVLVDLIINSLVAGTVTEYRTLAKAMTDRKWL